MEVMLIAFMVLHFSCCLEVTPITSFLTTDKMLKSPTIRYIRPGETVSICCDKNHRNKTMWYGQKYNRSPFIILSVNLTTGRNAGPFVMSYWGYNSRLNATWNSSNNSICLTINNITESDDGFYFCTVGDGIYTTPGTGHILIPESHITSTPPSVSTAGQVTSSGQSSEQCGINWTLLIILCSTSIFVTALVFLIVLKKRRKCTEASPTELQMQQTEDLEDDEEVQYSALQFSKAN